MRSASYVAFTLALLLPVTAGAQSFAGLEEAASGRAFTLSASPQYPAPYSTAAVSLSSSSLELNNATLTVSVNGKETYKGAAHSFPVELGAPGKSTKVTATISYQGSKYSQTISIQPQDVVLIAEPISSAPPLYPGKPSVPIDGTVRIVAMANLRDSSGKAAAAATYAYTWKVNDTRVDSASGIGRSSIVVPSPMQYRESEVSVAVTNSTGSLVGGAALLLSPIEPSVRVYENDPLLGIRYDHALTTNYTIGSAEATLYAAPFSFPTTSGAPLVQWFLNGSLAQTGNLVTLRPSGSGKGDASLSLVASAGDSTASQNFSLLFGQSKTNLFGL